jgi:CheY-like chemotaxis protein
MERTLGKHITIEVIKDPNLHVVEADPTQMQQVLMNLAINARDAMLEGGLLRLTTRNFAVDEEFARKNPSLTPGPHVQITVSDTGKGMDEETLGRIFDPFFTTKPVGEGTGLGLAMVYGIIRSHGGHIEVESHPGEGTTFGMYLPVGTPPIDDPTTRDEEIELRGGTETVLLVDDEPVILRLGASILERYGYTVLTAPSGRAALNLVEAHAGTIDLIVLDMVMPEMNGAELARALRARDPHCRILFSSGYTLDQDAESILKASGMLGFLPKPYRMSQLVHHVRHALDAPVPTPE